MQSAAPGVEAIQSSTLVSDADVRKEDVVRDRLEHAGFGTLNPNSVADLATDASTRS